MDRSLAIAGAIAATVVALGAVAWPSTPEPPPVLYQASASTRNVTVHVSGAVHRPGLVTLESSARVADAIAAAGGATPEATLGAVNLAAAVADGARIIVPDQTAGSGVGPDEGVRVNVASASDLQRLDGVGPVLAQRIVDHRTDHGPFQEVEDLLDVAGIGEAKLAAVRADVMVP